MRLNIFRLITLFFFCLNLSACALIREGKNYKDPTKPRYASTKKYTPTHTVDSIKVVSFNIKYAKKLQKALQVLTLSDKLANADVILLQEMDSESIIKLAESLEYNYVYYPASYHPFSNKEFGNAVLSKWPIVNDRKIILPHLEVNRLQRIAVEATVMVGKRKVHLYSIHMELLLKAYQRKDQLARIIHSIPPSYKNCIIAGDFNTFTNSGLKAIGNVFKEGGFKIATPRVGWTYKSWFLLGMKPSLDHIYERGFRTIASGKVFDRTSSDHFPVWTTLQFE